MDKLNEEIKENDSNNLESLNTSLDVDNQKPKSKLILNIILIISFLLISSYYLFSAPKKEKDVVIHISKNDSLLKISNDLGEKDIIRYPFLLRASVKLLSLDRGVKRGDYLFKKNENLFGVTWQIVKGKHNVSQIKVTLKEGFTNKEIADVLADKIPSFRKDLFLSDIRSKEGYLFPDTYFFFPMSTTDEILSEITSNFDRKINLVKKDIELSGKNIDEIIVMASILEKEANGKDDIEVISGILWKRIKIGMPLQVDAAPMTYDETGLPSKPISNPSLLSIKAAINPKTSPYLFYLHDDGGQVHFAMDFSEHRSNIAHYLK